MGKNREKLIKYNKVKALDVCGIDVFLVYSSGNSNTLLVDASTLTIIYNIKIDYSQALFFPAGVILLLILKVCLLKYKLECRTVMEYFF